MALKRLGRLDPCPGVHPDPNVDARLHLGGHQGVAERVGQGRHKSVTGVIDSWFCRVVGLMDLVGGGVR